MLKLLFCAVLSKITVSQVHIKVILCNFVINSGKSQVIVTRVTHIHSGLCKIDFFNCSIAGKCLKCLK